MTRTLPAFDARARRRCEIGFVRRRYFEPRDACGSVAEVELCRFHAEGQSGRHRVAGDLHGLAASELLAQSASSRALSVALRHHARRGLEPEKLPKELLARDDRLPQHEV